MREIGITQFDTKGYTDRNMLLNFHMITPTQLSRNLTYIWGKDSDRFPLLTLTEGQGLMESRTLLNGGDTQYKWPIAHRLRVTFRVKRLISGGAEPGRNHGRIRIETEDRWLIYQHTAIAPSGVQYRAENDGIPLATGGFEYTLQNMSGDKNKFSPLSDFATGAVWAMGASSIPGSKSTGNRSNNQSPTEATNQYHYFRYSKEIAGNMGNAIVNFECDLEEGGTTNLWMPYEMKMWEIQRRDQLEEDLWFSEYNRDENGIIHLTDPHTGEAIPKGAGVKEILKSAGNYETFSELSLPRFDRIIAKLFDNRIDTTVDELILYCGKGFSREFNNAIQKDAALKNYFFTMGEKEIQDSTEGFLSYGRYFNRYKLFNGKVLTVKCVDVFDQGIRARRDREAGRMYKQYPWMSYNACFLDHSMTSTQTGSKRNVQLVAEEGREYQVGVYKGMATLPNSWNLANDNRISDRQDIATYEIIGTQGINILNPTTSFWLEMDFE